MGSNRVEQRSALRDEGGEFGRDGDVEFLAEEAGVVVIDCVEGVAGVEFDHPFRGNAFDGITGDQTDALK